MENFVYGFVVDMDVDIFGCVEKCMYGNLEVDKIGLKYFKNVKKIKKFLERYIKMYLFLCDDGKNELIYLESIYILK